MKSETDRMSRRGSLSLLLKPFGVLDLDGTAMNAHPDAV
jgi:hypothetical protein